MFWFNFSFILSSFLWFSQATVAQEKLSRPSYVQISFDYHEGEVLIYDCLRESWICVMEDEAKRCQGLASLAKQKRDKRLPCAVISKFVSIHDCRVFQKEKVLKTEGESLCRNLDEVKPK